LAISQGRVISAQNSGSAVSLLFAAGRRPEGAAIRQVAEKQAGFSVSLDPSTQFVDRESLPDEPKLVGLELLERSDFRP